MDPEARTVAIVEDDDLVRSATVSLVRSLGLQVAPYRSALEFLDAPRIAWLHPFGFSYAWHVRP